MDYSFRQTDLSRTRRYHDADGDGVQANDDDLQARFEPGALRSREPSGHDLSNRNIGVLSGNHIRPLIGKVTILTRFQNIAYAYSEKGCYADNRVLVDSYLETI